MEKNDRREATEQTTSSPLERTSLAEVYQAYITLVNTMRKAHFPFTSLEMVKQKASYVIGIADTPKSKLYQLQFFSDEESAKRFTRGLSEEGRIYHCTNDQGHTIAA